MIKLVLAIVSQSTKCSDLRKQYLKHLNFCLNILYLEKDESCKQHHIRIDIPYLEKRTLRGRYSNSLVIDAGSQFSLRACSQAS
jgi:hypothetical protein